MGMRPVYAPVREVILNINPLGVLRRITLGNGHGESQPGSIKTFYSLSIYSRTGLATLRGCLRRFRLLVTGLAKSGGEPLETLVETIARCGAGRLDVL